MGEIERRLMEARQQAEASASKPSETCPHCSADLRDKPIPEEYLRVGYYGDWDGVTPQYYSRLIGVEIPGVYDGVLFWQCPDCYGRWHWWPAGSRQHAAAIRHMDLVAGVEAGRVGEQQQ